MNELLPINEAKLLAFFLPQYHPIPENNEWWGAGFTEWVNVMKGKPLFEGHYQPHFPADLGFYDLRVPEVREEQAALAMKAGLGGFIYYHYWFNGRRLLERPVNEILASGKPDFPFALCWANEPWSRNWDGQNRHVLMPQAYSQEDDLNHIRYLLGVFKDPRYIKIEGCPLFLIYRPSLLPDAPATFAKWRAEAVAAGFPGLHLCAVAAFPDEFRASEDYGLDALAGFKPNLVDCGPRLTSSDPLDIGYRLHSVWPYEQLVKASLQSPHPETTYYESVTPSWDNSVRRKSGGVIFKDATPERYGAWLEEVIFRTQMSSTSAARLIFINAWNEWAEGNHLEPCAKWGMAYINETRAALERATARFRSCQRLAGQVVDVVADCAGCVDLNKLGEDGLLSLEGWAAIVDVGRHPDALYIAEVSDDKYVLRFVVRDCFRHRGDVPAALGNETLSNTGWRFTHKSEPFEQGRQYVLLAFDAKRSLFFRATSFSVGSK